MTPDHDVLAQVHYPTDGTLTENLIFIFLFGKWLITKICFMTYGLRCCGASQNGGMILRAAWGGGKAKKNYDLVIGDTSRADLLVSELAGFLAPSGAPVAACPWRPRRDLCCASAWVSALLMAILCEAEDVFPCIDQE